MSAGTEQPPDSEPIVVDTAPPSTPGPTRVLVTNDDGIDAPGIAVLADTLATRFDVTVAAPLRDCSGAGTGIGRIEPTGVPLRRVEIAAGPAFAVDGPPGLAVMAAALGAFGGPFDVVVAGINAGINTGQSVIHSGTVGAALTARTFGAHGVAVSAEQSEPWQWQTAADIATAVVVWIATMEGDPIAVNLNVPGVPIEQVRGLRRARLDSFGYFRVALANEPGESLEFEVSSDCRDDPPADSDSGLLRSNYAAISVLGSLANNDVGLPHDLESIWVSTPV